MATPYSSLGSMSPSPCADTPQLTISPAETTLSFEKPAVTVKVEDPKPEEKKPVKKRKSWGQELPVPKTNLPPRKRAKTEDEKEQRRIERVLRNRAAAQTSRERKRLEVEKLEGEKQEIEQQNEFLLRRLQQMEAENNRLNQQVAQLSAEIRTSRGSSPQSISGSASPTLAPVLFKQERDELTLDKIPFPTPSIADYSPSLKASDLTDPSDLTQHPAAMLCDLQCQSEGSLDLPASHSRYLSAHPAVHHAVPLSDDELGRLFDDYSSTEQDLSLLEGGFSFDALASGDQQPFAFDSLVDFDPDPVDLDGLDSAVSFPDPASHTPSCVQPSFGASTSRCDEQGIAATGE
ncbi:hypothetical protein FQN50_002991 [Emmonsiellopsis sp. PD_5]|nr:hypothetical protein FQN50_002991 [Emmonsiellopsis sp. PD_5]